LRPLAALCIALALSACVAPSPGSDEEGMPETIRVGAPLDLSGIAAIAGIGTGEKRGMEVAAAEINESGFLGDSKIELEFADTKADKRDAAAAAIKLVQQDAVHAIVGFTLSPSFSAGAPAAARAETPIVVPVFGTGLEAGDGYAYGIYPNLPKMYPPHDVEIAESLGADTAAYLYDSDNPTATAITDARRDALEAAGVDTVTVQEVTSTTTDYRAQLTKIQQEDPDILVVSVLPGQYPAIFLQREELSIDVQVIASDGVATRDSLEQAGDSMECTVFTTAWSALSDEGRNPTFIESFQKAHPDLLPDSWAAAGYDALWFYAHAVKKAGTVEGTAVRDALAATSDFSGAFGNYGMNQDGQTTIEGTVLMIRDGAVESWSADKSCKG